MKNLIVTLSFLAKRASFPVPIKAGLTPLGTAVFNPATNRHEFTLTGEDYIKHAPTLAKQARDQASVLVPIAFEVQDNATEREKELADKLEQTSSELQTDIDRLNRELLDALKEIKELKKVSRVKPEEEKETPAEEPAHKEPEKEPVSRVKPEKTDGETPEEETEEQSPEDKPEITEDSLKKVHGFRKLRKLAKDIGVPDYTEINKEDELRAVILAHSNAAQEANG